MDALELLGVGIVLAALGARATSPASSRSVVLVGDSLGVGLAPPLAKLVAKGTTFHGAARGGTTTGQWLSRGWLQTELASSPAVVLVSLGTNDTTGGKPIVASDVAAFVKAAKANGRRVVWLLPPAMPWDTSSVATAARAVGAELLEAPAGLQRASDKIHCTPAGYAAWAAAIAAKLLVREFQRPGLHPAGDELTHDGVLAGTSLRVGVRHLPARRALDRLRWAAPCVGVVLLTDRTKHGGHVQR